MTLTPITTLTTLTFVPADLQSAGIEYQDL